MEIFKLFGIIDINGEAAIKTIENVAKKAGDAEKKMQDWQKTAVSVGKGLMAAGATIVGGMSAILVSTTKAGVEIDKLAKQTGRSREELQALGYAAQQEHASLAGLATGLNRLSRNMLDAAAGTGEAKDAFAALGISLVDANGNLRSSTDVLLDVADRFSQMTNETEMTAIAMKLFGRSGAELVPFLRMGGDEIRRLSQEARDLGFVMREQSVKDLKKFDDQLTALQAGFAGTGRQIAVALLPYAQQLAEWLTNAVKWFNGLPEPMRRTATVATALGGALALVAGPMLLIIGYIPQIVTGLGMLSGAFAPFLVGGAIVAGLAAIVTMFVQMKENARLAKLEIASISELAEAERARQYWAAEVERLEKAKATGGIRPQKMSAAMYGFIAGSMGSPEYGVGAPPQALEGVIGIDQAELDNAKKKLAEATAKVQELKKAQDDAAASSANLAVNLNLAGTKVEKTAYELAKEKFERTVFYENLTLDKQIELWQKSVAVYAKTTEEKFDSDKRLAELQKELEEGKARTEEENRQKRLASAESWIAHEVAMNRMSTEEQIKAYKRILDNYKLTEEEKTRIRRQIELLERRARQEALQDEIDKSEKALQAARRRAELISQGLLAPTVTSPAELKMLDEKSVKEYLQDAAEKELAEIERIIKLARLRVEAVMEGKETGQAPWPDLKLWDYATAQEGIEAGKQVLQDELDKQVKEIAAIVQQARLRLETVMEGKATGEVPWPDLKMWDYATAKDGLQAGKEVLDKLTKDEEEELKRRVTVARQKTDAILEGKEAVKPEDFGLLKMFDEKTLKEGIEAGQEAVKKMTDNEAKELERQLTLARQKTEAIMTGKAALGPEDLGLLKMFDEASIKEGAEAGKKAVEEIERYEAALFEFRRRIGAVTLQEELDRAYKTLEATKENTEERVKALEQVYDLERQAVMEQYGLERNLTEWQKQEIAKRLQAELAALDMSVEANRVRAEAIKGILADLSATIPTLEQMTASWGQTLIDGLARAIAYGEDLGDVFKNLLRQIAEWFIKYKVLMPLLGPAFGMGGFGFPGLGFAGIGLGGIGFGGPGFFALPFHLGGLVEPIRAHAGYLAPDEVPAILQTGERVLSRDQNKAFERLLAEPRQIQVQMHIHAVDAESFASLAQRHPEAITSVVIQEIQRNGAIRRVLMGR